MMLERLLSNERESVKRLSEKVHVSSNELERQPRPVRTKRALVCAGNAVTVGRHSIVTGIDSEYADRHKHNRRNHQNSEKSSMLGGHIQKLFRQGRTKSLDELPLGSMAVSLALSVAAQGETAFSYT